MRRGTHERRGAQVKKLLLLWMALGASIGFVIGLIVHPFIVGYLAGADFIDTRAAKTARDMKRNMDERAGAGSAAMRARGAGCNENSDRSRWQSFLRSGDARRNETNREGKHER